MTVDDVMKRVDVIRECVGDPEAAHGMEDQLWHDVLIAIAIDDVEGDPSAIALAAASTWSIEFPRWSA